MSSDELELPLPLSAGDMIAAQDKRTGHRRHGTGDIVASEQGRLWMYAELGERKLIDADEHDITGSGDAEDNPYLGEEERFATSACASG
jgi:hypothetical protein